MYNNDHILSLRAEVSRNYAPRSEVGYGYSQTNSRMNDRPAVATERYISMITHDNEMIKTRIYIYIYIYLYIPY
jgi:hypothetical protein